MAKKHFDEYVIKIQAQYEEMQKNLEQVAAELQDNQADWDYLEKLKSRIAPFRQNYKRVMHLKYLLDLPTKKQKQPKYKKRLEKAMELLGEENNPDSVLQENKNIIDKIVGA